MNVFKHDETENEDRQNISLRECQIKVFDMVKSVFNKFATVLICGSVYDISRVYEKSESMIINYFSGEGQHQGLFNNLYGLVNPSGRLPETWISSLDQNPLYERILQHDLYNEYYDEDIYVGYKYYINNQNGFILPFGFGLSYSNFEYEDYSVQNTGDCISVKLTLKNTSDIDGYDVIQIYVGKKDSNVYRAKYELKAFKNVMVNGNGSSTVELSIPMQNLAVYNNANDKMEVEEGRYQIYLCKDSFNIVKVAEVEITGKILPVQESPIKVERRQEANEYCLFTACEDFIKEGTGKIVKFLSRYNDVNISKVIEIMSWNCGMSINEIQWFGIISFDQILALIDYFNGKIK